MGRLERPDVARNAEATDLAEWLWKHGAFSAVEMPRIRGGSGAGLIYEDGISKG
jgi:hypothetical protein